MIKKNFLNIKKILNNNNLFYKQNNVYINKISENYSKNFELQWKEFPLTQFDSSTGFPLTRNRLLESSNWHFNEIKDKLIIELGSGAGRFTEIFRSAKSFLISVEMSDAVFINAKNNDSNKIIFIKSSLYDLKFLNSLFDYVFCYGVAQHTPNILKTYRSLYNFGKKKSKISIDHYLKLNYPSKKNLWRPITKRISPNLLLKIIKFYIPLYFNLDTFIRTKLPFFLSKLLQCILPIPCYNYTNIKNIPQNKKKLIEWAIMDTFDALGAKYDKPLFPHELERIAKLIGLKNFKIKTRFGFLVLNGIKKE